MKNIKRYFSKEIMAFICKNLFLIFLYFIIMFWTLGKTNFGEITIFKLSLLSIIKLSAILSLAIIGIITAISWRVATKD